MKSLTNSAVVVVCLCCVCGLAFQQSAKASPVAPSAIGPVVSAISSNAEAARANASIYQWVRVNREVDRMVAQQAALTNFNSTDNQVSAVVSSIQTDIAALRNARLDHDVARIAAAAGLIIADCARLKS